MTKYRDFPPGITKEMFEQSETATKHGINNTMPVHLLPNARRFAWEVMKPVMELFPNKCKWNSLFRSQALNNHVGGSKTSEHLKASAGDLHVEGVAPNIVHAILKGSKIQLSQCIRYDWGNHLGLNPNRTLQKNEYLARD